MCAKNPIFQNFTPFGPDGALQFFCRLSENISILVPDFIPAVFVGLLVPEMSYLGTFLLVFVCFGCAIVFSVASISSDAERAKRLLTRAKRTVCIAALIGLLFLIDDFSLDIVTGYSSTTLPLAYKLSALR